MTDDNSPMVTMNYQLALYTFGVFELPAHDPVNDGFHERNDPILAAVNQAPGFIARSGYEDEPGTEPWGETVYPEFYVERGDGWSPATLSLWQNAEAAFAFSYFGLHAEALAHGRRWMRKPEWPPYALWWVPGDQRPDWSEAVARHRHLHEFGPCAFAFNFKQPFNETGNPLIIDRARAKRIAATSD